MAFFSFMKRREDPLSSSTGVLPPELWLEVIASLPIQDACPLSNCSRTLRSLSTPRVFQTFVTRPFEGGIPGVLRQTLDFFGFSSGRRPSDCLAILAKPHISRAIETLAILPNGLFLGDAHLCAPERPTEMRCLIDEIFDVLPSLPNLKKLVCSHVTLFEGRVHTLLQLPLKHLELLRCALPGALAGLPKSPGTLESVKLMFYSSYYNPTTQSDLECATLFTALFMSPNLHSIRSINSKEVLRSLTISPPPSLTSLHLPLEAMKSPYFVPTLTLCHSLRSIGFTCRPGRHPSEPIPQLPPDSLPNLEYYTGPIEYVPTFTQNRPSITGIHIIHTVFTPIPSSSVEILPPSLETLKFTTFVVGPYLLPAVHSHFAFGQLRNFGVMSRGLGPRESLEDGFLVPLMGMHHFKASVFIGSRNDEDVVRLVGEYVVLLVRVYPQLEDATFVHPSLNKLHKGVVWSRREGGGDVTSSIKIVEMENDEEEAYL